MTHDGELGKRLLDKLVSVYLRDGGEQWVLLHLEVQGKRDPDFAERMFVYNYRVFDRYRRAVASLALLTDGSKRWHPHAFSYSLLGSATKIEFPVVKLQNFSERIDELLSDPNPFALVTVAYLQARKTKGHAHRRRIAKWRLTKLLYERRWSKQRIMDLYMVIDWIMRLPPELDSRFQAGILQLERRTNMAYISSMERYGWERGRKQGLQEGIQQGLQQGLQQGVQQGQAELLIAQIAQRFGPVSIDLALKLRAANPKQLAAWARNFVDAATLEEVFHNK